MPSITYKIMSGDEEEEFYDAIHELNYYASCGYLRYKIVDNSDNNYHVDYTVQKSNNNIVSSIKKNISIFRSYLETGKAVLSVDKNGKQIIRPATITKRYHYPVSYFTDEEEMYFNQSINTINKAMHNDKCYFRSFLDENACIIFNYGVNDSAENKAMLNSMISFVIQSVNEGKALRTEQTDETILIMPRLRLT